MWPPTGFVKELSGGVGSCIIESKKQYKVTCAVFTSFSLTSGQRPVGAPQEGIFTIQVFFLQEGLLGLHLLWEASPISGSPQ